MNKLTRWSKILVVFLAGLVLIVSTACSNMNSPQASRGNFSPDDIEASAERPDYDYYDANQSKHEGMNKYYDDPRLENPKEQQKADKLVKNAKANLENRNENFQEYAKEVSKTGEVLGNIKDDVADRADRFRKDISQGAQQRLDTTKNNLDKASKEIEQAAGDVSERVQDKT